MERTLEHRLAWLAGIIDGEGYMSSHATASSHTKKDGTRGRQLFFTVGIGNTDYSMISESVAISEAIGVKYIITMMKPRNAEKHKVGWKVRWHGWGRVEGILTATLPYLVNKRGRAELVLAMIRHRRTTAVTSGKRGKQGFGADAWLMSALGDLKYLNRRGPDQVEEHIGCP